MQRNKNPNTPTSQPHNDTTNDVDMTISSSSSMSTSTILIYSLTNPPSKELKDSLDNSNMTLNAQMLYLEWATTSPNDLRTTLEKKQPSKELTIEATKLFLNKYPFAESKKCLAEYVKAKKQYAKKQVTDSRLLIAELKLEILLNYLCDKTNAAITKNIPDIIETFKYTGFNNTSDEGQLFQFFRLVTNSKDNAVFQAFSARIAHRFSIYLHKAFFIDCWPTYEMTAILLQNMDYRYEAFKRSFYEKLLLMKREHASKNNLSIQGTTDFAPHTYFDLLLNHSAFKDEINQFLAIRHLLQPENPTESKSDEVEVTYSVESDICLLRFTFTQHQPQRQEIIKKILEKTVHLSAAELSAKLERVRNPKITDLEAKMHETHFRSKCVEAQNSIPDSLRGQTHLGVFIALSPSLGRSAHYDTGDFVKRIGALANESIRMANEEAKIAALQRVAPNSETGSNATIVRASKLLLRRYYPEITENNKYDLSKMNKVLKAIHNYLKHEYHNAADSSPVGKNYRTIKGFYLTAYERGDHLYGNISTKVALILVWLGIMDPQVNPTEADRDIQKMNFAERLLSIHDTHSKHQDTCRTSIFEEIMDATCHPDIQIYQQTDFANHLNDVAEFCYKHLPLDVRRVLHQEQLLTGTQDKPISIELMKAIRTKFYTSATVSNDLLSENEIEAMLDAFAIDFIRPVALEMDLIQFYQRTFAALPGEQQQEVLSGGSHSSNGLNNTLSLRFINEHKEAFLADLTKRHMIYPKAMLAERFQSIFYLEDFPAIAKAKHPQQAWNTEAMSDISPENSINVEPMSDISSTPRKRF